MWTLMDGGPIQGHTVVSGGSWLPLDMYPPPSLALFSARCVASCGLLQQIITELVA